MIQDIAESEYVNIPFQYDQKVTTALKEVDELRNFFEGALVETCSPTNVQTRKHLKKFWICIYTGFGTVLGSWLWATHERQFNNTFQRVHTAVLEKIRQFILINSETPLPGWEQESWDKLVNFLRQNDSPEILNSTFSTTRGFEDKQTISLNQPTDWKDANISLIFLGIAAQILGISYISLLLSPNTEPYPLSPKLRGKIEKQLKIFSEVCQPHEENSSPSSRASITNSNDFFLMTLSENGESVEAEDEVKKAHDQCLKWLAADQKARKRQWMRYGSLALLLLSNTAIVTLGTLSSQHLLEKPNIGTETLSRFLDTSQCGPCNISALDPEYSRYYRILPGAFEYVDGSPLGYPDHSAYQNLVGLTAGTLVSGLAHPVLDLLKRGVTHQCLPTIAKICRWWHARRE